mmetsp:Transcript_8410/g.12644  ORF Transcript_8410/g.12644 Transcript_8410/m.12644 type:complete len:99 (-) Transcript_8410:273-569(-)
MMLEFLQELSLEKMRVSLTKISRSIRYSSNTKNDASDSEDKDAAFESNSQTYAELHVPKATLLPVRNIISLCKLSHHLDPCKLTFKLKFDQFKVIPQV